MFLNLDQCRREYFHEGLTVIADAVPAASVAIWREQALRLARRGGIRRDLRADTQDVLGDGGNYHYRVVDGTTIREELPEMIQCYQSMVGLISAVTLDNVEPSPYERSAVNLILYEGKGDQQAWHYDTNRITALLYLTTNQEGGTECVLLDDNPHRPVKRTRIVLPQAGALLIMQGRKVWHRGLPVNQQTKLVALWNYYAPDDSWRPEGLDTLLYGSSQN
jgi:hypothetical protein